MNGSKGLYQTGFFVLKNHVARMLALTLSMVALIFLFLLFTILIRLNYQINLVAFWEFEYLFTKEWFFAIALFVLTFLIYIPFELGVRKWFYFVCMGKEQPLNIIFFYFEESRSYIKALWFQLMLSVRKVMWYFICLIPSILLKLTLDYPIPRDNLISGTIYGTLFALWVVSLAVGIFAGFYFNLKYFLSYYIWFESDDISILEAIRSSIDLMQGQKGKVLKAYFSLLPLVLLSIFVFPILALIPSSYILLSIQGKKILTSQQKDV